MKLVPTGAPGIVELVAIKIGDALLWAGRQVHGRYAVVPAAEVEPTIERLERWRVHLMAFVTHAAPLGFSQRKVIAAGVATRPGFEIYMMVLRKMGVVHTYPKSGTIWAAGWDRRKLLALLRRRLVEAPYPLQGEPPRVLEGRVAESQYAQPTQRAHVSSSVVFARDVEGWGDKE